MNYILQRATEPSTWRGLTMMATAFGLALQPDQVAAIVATGTAVAGLVGTFSKG